MRTMILAVTVLAVLLAAPALASAAGQVYLAPSNQYSDTVWYEGISNTTNIDWKTASLDLKVTVDSDTNLMAFSIDLQFPGGKLHCDTDNIAAGSFLTGSNADSWFFNLSVTSTIAPDGAGADTLTVTGSRMDATAGEKALNGDSLVLVTGIRFYRVSLNDLKGDSVSIVSGNLKFRGQFNDAPTVSAVGGSGWYFWPKGYMEDYNLDGQVNATDIGNVRVNSGGTNYTYDANEDGQVNATDIGRTRLNSGNNW